MAKLIVAIRDFASAPNKTIGLQAHIGQEVEAPRFSGQSAHERGDVVSPTHRPFLPPRENPWYSFLLESKSTQWS